MFYSKNEGENEVNSVYRSTRAVLFLGTPHRGSGLSQAGATLERILRVAGFDTNKQTIRTLVSNSTDLVTCQENFLQLFDQPQRNFRVRTFQEAKGLTGWNFLNLSNKVWNYEVCYV
jgi:hypothetical protein